MVKRKTLIPSLTMNQQMIGEGTHQHDDDGRRKKRKRHNDSVDDGDDNNDDDNVQKRRRIDNDNIIHHHHHQHQEQNDVNNSYSVPPSISSQDDVIDEYDDDISSYNSGDNMMDSDNEAKTASAEEKREEEKSGDNAVHSNSDVSSSSSSDDDDDDDDLPYGAPNRFLNHQGGGVQQQMNMYRQQQQQQPYTGVINNYQQLGRGANNNNNPTASNDDNNNEGEDEKGEWMSGVLEDDRLVFENLGPPSMSGECFGCEHVGLNAPPIKKSNLERLVQSIHEGDKCTEPWRHAKNISNQYEKTIKTPSNKYRIEGEGIELPNWKPADVHQHLNGHINTEESENKFFRSTFMGIAKYIKDNSLVQEHSVEKNYYGKPKGKIPTDQFRILRDAADMVLKFRRMAPKNVKENDLKDISKNSVIDCSQKKIITNARLALMEKKKQARQSNRS